MTRPRSVVTRGEPLHQQVARNIRNDIQAGVLRDGQRLPSTKEMADEWGVSTFTIKEAMDLLVKEGLVITKPRAGRVVNAPEEQRRQEIRPAAPRVVMIGGYAGSGKTELGRILARETGWSILDKDTLTRPVVEAALELLGNSPNDRESDLYRTKIRPREYEALTAAVNENVQCGNSSVVTAPFLREFTEAAWINRVQAQLNDMGAETTLVWMNCDANTMHTYLRHRGAARDAGKLANWDEYLSQIDVEFRPPAPHYVVDNCASSEPLQDQAQRLIEELLKPEGEE